MIPRPGQLSLSVPERSGGLVPEGGWILVPPLSAVAFFFCFPSLLCIEPAQRDSARSLRFVLVCTYGQVLWRRLRSNKP